MREEESNEGKKAGTSPVSPTWMGNVRINNLFYLVRFCHFIWVLSFLYHELEPPEQVRSQTEPAADSRAVRIAQEPEVLRKEEVIYLLRSVSKFPEREFRVRIRCWESELPVKSDPSLLIRGSRTEAISLGTRRRKRLNPDTFL